jgi:hypothetical protein
LIKNDKIAFFFCFKLIKKIDYRQQMVKLYFFKKIEGQKMHQTKKIKNNRSNVMA